MIQMKDHLIRSIGTLCLAAVLLAGCEKTPQKSMERPPATVVVGTAVTRNVPLYIDAIGRTVASKVVTVKPQVGGCITKIHFVDGAELKEGDPLFTIDPRPYKAKLDAANATLAEKKASLDLAKIQFDRYAGLLETNSVAQTDYDTKKNNVETSEAQVLQSQAAVEEAKLNLDYCYIASPVQGRAGLRLVDNGNVVSANSSSLLLIERLHPIYADFTITEHQLPAVKEKLRQGVLQASVSLSEQQDDPREAEVAFLDNAVQESTGTIKLRATLLNEDDHFWPGQLVRVRLFLDTIHDAVIVPAKATRMSAKGPFLFVVRDDSTAELRQVSLGQRHGDSVVINEGVKAGERVVMVGHLGVAPGAKVRVNEALVKVGPSTEQEKRYQ
ncbi:MAG: efflux RND transporter periplasmic adaptor subunit [Desulfomonile tiedjei]|uniref:Efflux RND transporter periplasmic adaptor subunit n=1 Tax=Desulfomonile tiedjei TaxID=2358 RepID=A0A9D6V5X2_9BACT|nr:efflux RND transporter periplasmic adaptor subunit [Desulfomonile tiedjei]